MDRESRRRVMTGDRQSTHNRPGRGKFVRHASQSKRTLNVKRQYKKLRDKLGDEEVKTYDIDALDTLDAPDKGDTVARTSGRENRVVAERGADRGESGHAPPQAPAHANGPKRNRTKEKKAFFKKTRSGQPVMKTRIGKLLDIIKKGT